MMQRWRHYLLGAALAVLGLTTGCSILPKSEPQTRFTLPAAALDTHVPQQKGVLFVAVPQGNRLISSNYVLIQPEHTEIQVYKGTLWADTVPSLLRERLITAFSEAQLFDAISGDAALRSDLALETYVQRFQVQFENDQPIVHVQADAKLVDSNTASIVRSQRFYVTQPAQSKDVVHLVAAFGQATDQLSLELIQWLSRECDKLTLPIQ